MLWKWNEKRRSLWGVYQCINVLGLKYGQNEVGDIENKLKSDKASLKTVICKNCGKTFKTNKETEYCSKCRKKLNE